MPPGIRILFVGLFGLVGLTPSQSRAADSLEASLAPILDKFEGRVAIAVKHLETSETYFRHENDPMPTASLIKFPLMIEAYRQFAEKTLDLQTPIVLKKADMVPGSGILTYHFSEGASFPLRDAIHLMIVYSDNTATNLVIDKVGLPATAATMAAMGYPNTKLHSKVYRRETSVFPERSKVFGLGSTTAIDMLRLLELLHQEKLVNKEASQAMHAHMLACDDDEKFPRFLLAGTKLAFKTGSVGGTRTAAGILYTKRGPVAICVLSTGHPDERYVLDNAGNRLCADVAKAVYDYYPALPAPAEAQPVPKP